MKKWRELTRQKQLAWYVRIGIAVGMSGVLAAGFSKGIGWGDALGIAIGLVICLLSANSLFKTEFGTLRLRQLRKAHKFWMVGLSVVCLGVLPFFLLKIGKTPATDAKYVSLVNNILLGASLVFLLCLSDEKEVPRVTPPGALSCGCVHDCKNLQSPSEGRDLTEARKIEETPKNG